jgi:hypothetical protein
MPRRRRTGERSLALFFLGLAALTPPILAVFDVADSWFGIPVLYLYVFVAWGALILLMGITAALADERPSRSPRPRSEPTSRPEDR